MFIYFGNFISKYTSNQRLTPTNLILLSYGRRTYRTCLVNLKNDNEAKESNSIKDQAIKDEATTKKNKMVKIRPFSYVKYDNANVSSLQKHQTSQPSIKKPNYEYKNYSEPSKNEENSIAITLAKLINKLDPVQTAEKLLTPLQTQEKIISKKDDSKEKKPKSSLENLLKMTATTKERAKDVERSEVNEKLAPKKYKNLMF